jgi:hypothetical protein
VQPKGLFGGDQRNLHERGPNMNAHSYDKKTLSHVLFKLARPCFPAAHHHSLACLQGLDENNWKQQDITHMKHTITGVINYYGLHTITGVINCYGLHTITGVINYYGLHTITGVINYYGLHTITGVINYYGLHTITGVINFYGLHIITGVINYYGLHTITCVINYYGLHGPKASFKKIRGCLYRACPVTDAKHLIVTFNLTLLAFCLRTSNNACIPAVRCSPVLRSLLSAMPSHTNEFLNAKSSQQA